MPKSVLLLWLVMEAVLWLGMEALPVLGLVMEAVQVVVVMNKCKCWWLWNKCKWWVRK